MKPSSQTKPTNSRKTTTPKPYLNLLTKLSKRKQLLILIAFIVGFGSIGAYFLVQSRANTCVGVAVNPGDSIQGVVNAHPNGTTFCIKAGTHRNQIVDFTNKPGTKLIGEPGAVLNGSRLLTSFAREGSYYVATGQTQENTTRIGECRSTHPRCTHPEDLFINDEPLHHVGSLSQVGPGKYFFDYPNDKIYFVDDPAGKKVEASITWVALYGGTNITIKGLIIEKYASRTHFGTVGHGGQNWIIEDNLVRLNHASGISTATGHVIRNNHAYRNGQIGISSQGTGVLVENNEISHNNYANYNPDWEGGGTKFAFTDGLIARGNHIHHNNGYGLWTDIDNRNTIFENNRVHDNTYGGIFHEISYGNAVIRNNTSENNGMFGIYVSTSSDVEVYGNKVRGNKQQGIWVSKANRPPWDTFNVHVYDNDVQMPAGSFSGLVQWVGDNSYFTSKNIRFSGNRYYVDNTGGSYWHWLNGLRTFAQWQAYNQDTGGSVRPSSEFPDTGTEPPPADTTAPSVSLTFPANGDTVSSTIDITANASDNVGVTKVEFYRGSTLLGSDSSSPYSYSWDTGTVANGSHSLTAKALDAAGNSKTSAVVTVTVSNGPAPDPTPYGAVPSIPSKIEAENFDNGGQNVAYYDKDAGNNGGAYRTTDVDIKATADADGGHAVGWFQTGEWLKYTVDVPKAGTYRLTARMSNIASDATFRLDSNGQDKTGNISVPNTGSYDVFAEVTKDVTLSAGRQILTFTAVSASAGYIGDLNWFSITQPDPDPTKPGDVNGDNKVDISDLSILLTNWNSTTFPSADLNQDGVVNISDLSILLSNWGS